MSDGGRRRAVVLAGHRGDAATARGALDDADPATRGAALGALARCGTLTPADLLVALGDADPEVRRRAAEEAGRLGHPDVVDALVGALGDADDRVTEAATHALGEIEPPPGAGETVATAIAALVTGHAEVVVRETAVAALGSLGEAVGLDAVLAATGDVATVRRRAVLALAAFEGPEVDAALERLATDRDRQTRQSAEDLLHDWGGGDLPTSAP
jgi:HEAT repeat protein